MSSSKSNNSLNSTNVTDSSSESKGVLSIFRSSKMTPKEEADLLEVLSLCDAADFENDEVSELSSNFKFSLISVMGNKLNFIEGVELRRKYQTFNGSKKRKEKGRSCPFSHSRSNRNGNFSNSLPLTKRSTKKNNDQLDGNFKMSIIKDLTIPIDQEPFNNMELHSPSSASLNSSKNFVIDLGTKSNSAPVLIKNNVVKDEINYNNVSIQKFSLFS